MFALGIALLDPGVEVVLGLDILESLLLLVDLDDVGIRVVLVTLYEVLHHITFAHTTGTDDGYDIALPYPRIQNISVILPC